MRKSKKTIKKVCEQEKIKQIPKKAKICHQPLFIDSEINSECVATLRLLNEFCSKTRRAVFFIYRFLLFASSSIARTTPFGFLKTFEPRVILQSEMWIFFAISRWVVPLSISRIKSQRFAKSLSSAFVHKSSKNLFIKSALFPEIRPYISSSAKSSSFSVISLLFSIETILVLCDLFFKPKNEDVFYLRIPNLFHRFCLSLRHFYLQIRS